MTKVTCDMCSDVLLEGQNVLQDRVKLLICGSLMDTDMDLCVSCAVRVNNKILSFIEAAKKKEGAHGNA